jgi:hypothetical protein
MTTRTIARPLALLAGVAIFVAACGGSAATQAPGATTGTGVTQAPATQAPATQAAGATAGAVPSFAIPSFHGAVDLEKLVPTQIGGEAVSVNSMSGATFLGGGGSDEISGVLSGLGKQPSDLSVAFGFNTKVSILAFQVNGVPGNTILEAFKNASTDGATLSDVSIGGKSVKKVTPADAGDDVTYAYATQDVVFVVSGDNLTDALLTEAFSKLP